MRVLAGLIGAIVAALLVVWLTNCASNTRRDTPPAPTPVARPAEEPSQPVESPPSPPQPQLEPTRAVPELPPYLEITESLPGAAAKIESTLPAPNAIELKTDGVKRLRLLRSEWPHRVATSIAVRIDKQGIEWTPRYAVLELERRDNGDWAIVRPVASPPAADRP